MATLADALRPDAAPCPAPVPCPAPPCRSSRQRARTASPWQTSRTGGRQLPRPALCADTFAKKILVLNKTRAACIPLHPAVVGGSDRMSACPAGTTPAARPMALPHGTGRPVRQAAASPVPAPDAPASQRPAGTAHPPCPAPSRHMFPGDVALPPAQPATNLPRRLPLCGTLGTPRRTRNRPPPAHPPIRQNGTYRPKNILPKTGKRDIHCNSCQALEECSGRSSASCTICLAFFWRTKRKRSCPGAWPFVACLRFRSDIPRELRFGQRHTGTTLRAIRPPADRGLPARHRHTEAQPLPT